MKIVPTWKELKIFISYNKRVSLISFGVIFTLFLLLYGYNLLSTEEIQMEEEYLSQAEIIEILNSDPEDVDSRDLDDIDEALGQERYHFTVLVESISQELISNQHVMKSILIRDDVVDLIEEEVGFDITIDPSLITSVYNENNMLRIAIGTGDVVQNKMITQAYYDAFNNGDIPYFDNKSVYLIDNEPFMEEEETWFDLALIQDEGLSISEALTSIILVIITSVIIAIVIPVIKTIFQKNVPVAYKLEQDEHDKVIDLNNLSVQSENDYLDSIAYTILSSKMISKLVLSQGEIMPELLDKLSISSKKNNQKITIANDIIKTDPSLDIDEIFILVQLNQTEKHWYQNQRIQIKNIAAPVTIIQL